MSSEKMIEHMCEANGHVFLDSMVLRAGQPRNDFLIRNSNNSTVIQALKRKYAVLLGLPEDKRWYLYMPTWRHDPKKCFSFSTSARLEDYANLLHSQNAVLIEKQHPITMTQMALRSSSDGSVFVADQGVSFRIDTQELLLVADRLITDYSSCFFDYELMNRPVIHFAYDLDDYVNNDTGALYDLHDIAAGPVVGTEEELFIVLGKSDSELLSAKGTQSQEPVAYEKGCAAKTIIERFWGRA